MITQHEKITMTFEGQQMQNALITPNMKHVQNVQVTANGGISPYVHASYVEESGGIRVWVAYDSGVTGACDVSVVIVGTNVSELNITT